MKSERIELVLGVVEQLLYQYLEIKSISGECFVSSLECVYVGYMNLRNNFNEDEKLFLEIFVTYINDVFEYYESAIEYDPNYSPRSADLFGDDELMKRVKKLLEKIDKYKISQDLYDLIPDGFENDFKNI